jgi:hypothetical protein
MEFRRAKIFDQRKKNFQLYFFTFFLSGSGSNTAFVQVIVFEVKVEVAKSETIPMHGSNYWWN